MAPTKARTYVGSMFFGLTRNTDLLATMACLFGSNTSGVDGALEALAS